MLTSVMVDVHEKEFDYVELDFVVEFELHIRIVSLSNFSWMQLVSLSHKVHLHQQVE